MCSHYRSHNCSTVLLRRVAKERNRHYEIIMVAEQFRSFYQVERSDSTKQQLSVRVCSCVYARGARGREFDGEQFVATCPPAFSASLSLRKKKHPYTA